VGQARATPAIAVENAWTSVLPMPPVEGMFMKRCLLMLFYMPWTVLPCRSLRLVGKNREELL
jgi:hypothetical protein